MPIWHKKYKRGGVLILGVDLGNWNVKTSEEDIFPSRYTIVENILGATGDVLEYEGIKYYMRDGKLENNYDKANKETNLMLFLYSLALQNDKYFKAVVGLPALAYKANRDTFKDNTIINKEPKKIIIEDLIVFPEGAGAYFSLKNRPKNAVIIDIGGGTINIVSFKNGKLDSCTTIGKGMIELYNQVRDYLNATYTLKLELEDIEIIMREGLKVDNEEISFTFIKPIIDSFIKDLMNELRNFPIRTSKVLLSGGGSKLLKAPLSKIPGLEVIEDYLFSNSKGFKKVGESKWKEWE